MARTFLINDTAQVLGISRRTVYYWIRNGRLKTIVTRLGTRRVTLESVEEALRVRVPRDRDAGVSSTVPCGISPAP